MADQFNCVLLVNTCQQLVPFYFRYLLGHELPKFDLEDVQQFVDSGLLDRTPRKIALEILADYEQLTNQHLVVTEFLGLPWSPSVVCDEHLFIQLDCGTLYHPCTDNFYSWPQGYFGGPVLYLGGDRAVISLDGDHYLVSLKNQGNPKQRGSYLVPPANSLQHPYFRLGGSLYSLYFFKLNELNMKK